jgi:hypothetical protein
MLAQGYRSLRDVDPVGLCPPVGRFSRSLRHKRRIAAQSVAYARRLEQTIFLLGVILLSPGRLISTKEISFAV